MTVVEEQPADQYRVLASVPTQERARTMALDTKTHNLLLVTAKGSGRNLEPGSFVILVVGKKGQPRAPWARRWRSAIRGRVGSVGEARRGRERVHSSSE